jgi:hypothetical protein
MMKLNNDRDFPLAGAGCESASSLRAARAGRGISKGRNMTMILGTELTADDQQHALAVFVHRFTREHKPDWASKPWKDGKAYPVQHASYRDWLANTRFAVRKDGTLDERVKSCSSNPTWPDNPELHTVNS